MTNSPACTVIDYGMGNLGSIGNMLSRIGVSYSITSCPDEVASATRIVLPGVGAFSQGMENLGNAGLIRVLSEAVIQRRVPILGICLGMHLLTRGSEEGSGKGLGWLAADSVRFVDNQVRNGRKLKVPHMGWNDVHVSPHSRLYEDSNNDLRFYFVHSYYVRCDDVRNIASRTTYGLTFASSVEADNIFGVQFHPEKSHKFGMTLLGRFARI